MPKAKILVVDDEPETREQIARWLSTDDYWLDEATSGEEALEKVRQTDFSVVLLDWKLPQMDGYKVLTQLKKEYPDICVIILTAYGDAEITKRAMNAGAFDFFDKPLKYRLLVPRIASAVERFNLSRERNYQTEEEQQKFTLDKIIGKSPKMLAMLERIEKVAKSEAPVLILGESGTGKELVAKVIHYSSPRHDKTLMIADCSTITPSLIESELFGHEKGAFTGAIRRKKGKFERAHEGTLFIDEIGELDQHLQMKLLRFLQEGTIERVGGEEVIKVDARVLAATAVDLKKAIQTARFRTDLYYRLNVVTIEIPPLRERKEDIPLLVDHFIRIYSRKNLKTIRAISEEAMRRLLAYDFRGNVRELENIIHRAIVLTDDEVIGPSAIGFDLLGSQHSNINQYFDMPIKQFTDACERDYVIYHLNKNDWHISKTAKAIGIDRSNLSLKIKKYGISSHDEKFRSALSDSDQNNRAAAHH